MSQLKIIARYQDGRIVKGVTNDFWPDKDYFHINPVDGGDPAQIAIGKLKAVFVVKSFEGNPEHKDAIAAPPANYSGKGLKITFHDGESIAGSTMDYNPTGQGFFIFPFDTNSNNQRIFVVNGAVHDVEHL